MSIEIPRDVILRAQAGDDSAPREIVDLFHRPLRSMVFHRIGHRFPGDVDDCVQEIFMRIFSHIGDYDFSRRVKFTTWAYTFARNYCIDHMKRKRLRSFSMNTVNKEGDETGEWIGFPDPPERKVEGKEFAGALKRALGELPAELRRIFRMREVDGLEFQAIARRLSLPLGTVKSKHYRALDQLRFVLRSFRLAS